MTKHSACIARLLKKYPRIKTNGFKVALRAALAGADYLEGIEVERVNIFPNIVPDGYLILPDVRTVICWEVTDTHRFDEAKYGELFWLLDAVSWRLSVIHIETVNESWKRFDVTTDDMAQKFYG